jgi:hypothetical protein
MKRVVFGGPAAARARATCAPTAPGPSRCAGIARRRATSSSRRCATRSTTTRRWRAPPPVLRPDPRHAAPDLAAADQAAGEHREAVPRGAPLAPARSAWRLVAPQRRHRLHRRHPGGGRPGHPEAARGQGGAEPGLRLPVHGAAAGAGGPDPSASTPSRGSFLASSVTSAQPAFHQSTGSSPAARPTRASTRRGRQTRSGSAACAISARRPACPSTPRRRPPTTRRSGSPARPRPR